MKIKACKREHPNIPTALCFKSRGHDGAHEAHYPVGYGYVDDYQTVILWSMADPSVCPEVISVMDSDNLGLPVATDKACTKDYGHDGLHLSGDFEWVTHAS